MGFKARQYEMVYNGVFVSPFDYDMNMCKVELARLRESLGNEPTEEQRGAVLRLERFEELGGIDESYLSSSKPISGEELESILEEMSK